MATFLVFIYCGCTTIVHSGFEFQFWHSEKCLSFIMAPKKNYWPFSICLFTMSKMDLKVCRRIPDNWHFSSHFVLKTTETPVFVFISEILWQLTICFWRCKKTPPFAFSSWIQGKIIEGLNRNNQQFVIQFDIIKRKWFLDLDYAKTKNQILNGLQCNVQAGWNFFDLSEILHRFQENALQWNCRLRLRLLR